MADSQTVFYMDIGEYLTTADSTITADVMPDFLHPSQRGAAALAQCLAPEINRLVTS